MWYSNPPPDCDDSLCRLGSSKFGFASGRPAPSAGFPPVYHVSASLPRAVMVVADASIGRGHELVSCWVTHRGRRLLALYGVLMFLRPAPCPCVVIFPFALAGSRTKHRGGGSGVPRLHRSTTENLRRGERPGSLCRISGVPPSFSRVGGTRTSGFSSIYCCLCSSRVCFCINPSDD